MHYANLTTLHTCRDQNKQTKQHNNSPHRQTDADTGDMEEFVELVQKYRAPAGAELDRSVGELATEESEYWVPEEAFYTVDAFKRRHFPDMPVALFTNLLRTLNAVWASRERRTHSRLRAELAETINNLKRRVNHSVGYSERLHLSKIQHLKAQLRRAQSGARAAARRDLLHGLNVKALETGRRLAEGDQSEKLSGKDSLTRGSVRDILSSAISTVEGLTRQLSISREQNRVLREQLGMLRTGRRDSAMEGAAWMARRFNRLITAAAEALQGLAAKFQRDSLKAESPQGGEAVRLQLAYVQLQNVFLAAKRGVVRDLLTDSESLLSSALSAGVDGQYTAAHAVGAPFSDSIR